MDGRSTRTRNASNGRAQLIAIAAVLHAATLGAATCPQITLPSTLPVTMSGTTVGGMQQTAEPSCSSTDGAPDATFLWTAPSTGLFTIDTNGSDFDTVLVVRDASCAGAELACNDDAEDFPPQSLVTIALTAGQQVVVVVTGFAGASGNYVLHIGLTPTPTPTPTALPSTRLYFRSDPPPVDPGVDGIWQDTTRMARYHMAQQKFGVMTQPHAATETDGKQVDVLVYEFVSPPLSADHTFSSSADLLRLVPGVQASDVGMHAVTHARVWVTVGDSDASRCLLVDFIVGRDWPPTPAGVDDTQYGIGDCAVRAGDRLVVELGYHAGNTDTLPHTGTIWRGGEDEDLADGADPTIDRPGFLELTGSLMFAAITTPLPTQPEVTPSPGVCTGDCNHNGAVTVDELLTIVNIALGMQPLTACPAGDRNGDQRITVDEILDAVNRALSSCLTPPL